MTPLENPSVNQITEVVMMRRTAVSLKIAVVEAVSEGAVDGAVAEAVVDEADAAISVVAIMKTDTVAAGAADTAKTTIRTGTKTVLVEDLGAADVAVGAAAADVVVVAAVISAAATKTVKMDSAVVVFDHATETVTRTVKMAQTTR